MKIIFGRYAGSPCWQVRARWLDVDADWNTRFPFGTSMGVHFGPDASAPGFLLDLNAPFGEPNRLYVMTCRWHVTIPLITWWTFRESGREGRVVHGDWVRCRPRLVDGGAVDVAHRQASR